MKTAIQEQYEGECPDCLELIDDSIEHEMECENCGHVFLDESHTDDRCTDPQMDSNHA